MAESVQIRSVSHRHEAIADWLLLHPEEKNLNALCADLHVSRSWLSIVMNSDAFKEYFARRRKNWEEHMHERIGAKLMCLAEESVEKAREIVSDDETDPRLIAEIANKTLDRLGFAPKIGRTIEERVQEFSRPVPAGIVGEARELIRRTTITQVEEDVKKLPAP